MLSHTDYHFLKQTPICLLHIYNHIKNYQVSRKKQKKNIKKKSCVKNCHVSTRIYEFTYFAVQQCHHIFMLQQCELLKFDKKKKIKNQHFHKKLSL